MANQHKHAPRQIRGVPDEEVKAFDAAAEAAGSNRSSITRAFWAWFAGQPGAELPHRPTANSLQSAEATRASSFPSTSGLAARRAAALDSARQLAALGLGSDLAGEGDTL